MPTLRVAINVSRKTESASCRFFRSIGPAVPTISDALHDCAGRLESPVTPVPTRNCHRYRREGRFGLSRSENPVDPKQQAVSSTDDGAVCDERIPLRAHGQSPRRVPRHGEWPFPADWSCSAWSVIGLAWLAGGPRRSGSSRQPAPFRTTLADSPVVGSGEAADGPSICPNCPRRRNRRASIAVAATVTPAVIHGPAETVAAPPSIAAGRNCLRRRYNRPRRQRRKPSLPHSRRRDAYATGRRRDACTTAPIPRFSIAGRLCPCPPSRRFPPGCP